ncbi:MAG: hypothetical protein IT561_08335 [Alphaproteobacteria bacterium]|nr:hypothetical protein [Alphaproteobacteria bacterium]
MVRIISGRSPIIALSLAAALASGCSTISDLTGLDAPGSAPAGESVKPTTFVGERAVALDGDLRKLRATHEERAAAVARLKGAAAAESAAYNGTVQEIAERLQAGATALDSKLLAQWTEARGHLARVDETVSRMRALDADLTGDRARGTYLGNAARGASELAGGTEAELALLRRVQAGYVETNGALDGLAADLGGEIRRHGQWLTAERQRSDQLLAAVRAGTAPPARAEAPAGRAPATAATPAAPVAAPAAATAAPAPTMATPVAATGNPPGKPVSVDGRRPFVVIRFDRADVEYERPLYEALRVAVDRDPRVRFDVVAVSPKDTKVSARTVEGYARKVAKSMVAMGLDSDQARTYERSISGISEPQVHLYIRRR